MRIIEDPAIVRCAILGRLNCGLQGSVVRAAVFQDGRFCYDSRNIAIDQLTVIKALKAGVRFAYFDDVHVLYRVHAENSSAAAAGADQKTLRVLEDEAWCYEELTHDPGLTAAERRAAYYRWGSICFWAIGYSLYWQHGRWSDADKWFRKGLRLWPWDCRCWKTYVLAQLRARLAPQEAA